MQIRNQLVIPEEIFDLAKNGNGLQEDMARKIVRRVLEDNLQSELSHDLSNGEWNTYDADKVHTFRSFSIEVPWEASQEEQLAIFRERCKQIERDYFPVNSPQVSV